MSNLSLFLKKNKTTKKNTFFPATKSLRGEDGKPLLWEIKPISTAENDEIQDACTIATPIPGKPNMVRHSVDATKYAAKLITASVASPDLYNAELQDSYGVKTPEALLKEMVDNPGEYSALLAFVTEFNELGTSLQEEVVEAKN